MEISKVRAAYFSATETTKLAVQEIAASIAKEFGTVIEELDFTLPAARKVPMEFGKGELVVFGTPVYAGRIPNVLLKYLETICGNSALAVAVVMYGNRHYDDALIELRDLLQRRNLHTIAAAAFIGEHSFSKVLAAGRPDEEDRKRMRIFGAEIAHRLKKESQADDFGQINPVSVSGCPYPYRGYYQPRDRKGNPVDIRKVLPVTASSCCDCKLCAEICPMGSIDYDHVSELKGICIKCCACIKRCPVGAKHFDDAGYLYHKKELEEGYQRRAEPEWFFSDSLSGQ